MLQVVQLLACSRTAKVLLWAPWLSLFWIRTEEFDGRNASFLNEPLSICCHSHKNRLKLFCSLQKADAACQSSGRRRQDGFICHSHCEKQNVKTEGLMDPIMWPVMTFIWTDTSGSPISGWFCRRSRFEPNDSCYQIWWKDVIKGETDAGGLSFNRSFDKIWCQTLTNGVFCQFNRCDSREKQIKKDSFENSSFTRCWVLQLQRDCTSVLFPPQLSAAWLTARPLVRE